jgi:hypothetical protein
VHKVHSKGEGLFSGLMHWIELFLDIVREGLGEPISLEFILPHTGDERRDTIKEIDEVALHHYKLKVAYESKLRRRFGRTGGANIGGDDENTREIVGGLVRDVSFGDFMKGGMLDVAAEEEEYSDDSDESGSDYESETDDGETESEEESSESSSRPSAQLHTFPSTPSLPKTSPLRAHEPFPPPQQSKLAVAPPNKTPSPSPLTPARAPSIASPSSTGTRLRKLSLTLRKSRSMTFGATRPSPSNNAEALPPPVPPVPSLPQSVAQSRSVAPLSASQSKHLTASSSASPSRRLVRAPTAPSHPPNARASHKRFPSSQNSPQVPKRQSKLAPEALKPPELKKLSELLPVFVEMVRQDRSPFPEQKILLMFLFFVLARRFAPHYVYGLRLRDNQPQIPTLDKWGIEFVVSTVYSLGAMKTDVVRPNSLLNFVFFPTTNPSCQKENGVYWSSLRICMTSDNKYC